MNFKLVGLDNLITNEQNPTKFSESHSPSPILSIEQILKSTETLKQDGPLDRILKYCTSTIKGCSRYEAALVYKPRILSLKNEEFPFLVHKLSAI